MSLKVIGAGFGRTGTRSLKDALNEIGFGPCYHMSEVFPAPERAEAWIAAARGETVDWDAVFEGYRSTVDWPGAAFWVQLCATYPEAKVLLSVRDPERWYESCLNTIYPETRPGGSQRHGQESEAVYRMIDDVVWQGTFGGTFEDKERSLDIFRRHIEEVRENVAADRLLVYEVREGWEPLCEFLRVKVPDTPFPRVNTTEDWRRRESESAG